MPSSSLFGKIALTCSLLSVCSVILFLVSGVLFAGAGESVLVPLQMITVILTPTLPLIGLGFAIAGIYRDVPNGLAKAGAMINGILIVLIAIAASLLMIAAADFKVDVEERQEKVPQPVIEGSVDVQAL